MKFPFDAGIITALVTFAPSVGALLKVIARSVHEPVTR
jgi:hypothetical protein